MQSRRNLAFLDLMLANGLENEITMSSFNTRVDRMAEILNNPAMLLGLATLDRALADAAEGVEVQSSGRGSAAQPRTRYPARPKRQKPTA